MGQVPASVCVVGLGYIGLPTAAILARNGLDVVGVDVNPRHVDAVNAGELPFVEEGLGEVIAEVVAAGKLSAQATTPASEVYIVAVPTPFRDEYQVDVKYIDAATDGIIPQLSGGELLVLESTSPPGTTEHMRDRVLAARPELEGKVDFAHAPERVLPGRMMEELVSNDRVIGGVTPEAAERARDLYAVFCKGDLFLTDARTAELSKLAENSFRDVNIAFANELSLICDQLGVNVWELIELANKHPRVNILQPGPGVGGHCIAVDPWFIVSSAPTLSRLIRTAREVNDGKPTWVIDQVHKALAEQPGARVAALGLAFKPDIDDLRESPALNIADQLATELGEDALLVVEPNVPELPARLAGRNIQLVGLDEALAQADLVVLLVDHKEFKELPAERLTGKRVIDTRGTWRDLA
jgi:UDP-N-acetyl-D-mannosaminuronic acid dehydrogenase